MKKMENAILHENRKEAVELALDLLQNKKLNIIELYDILRDTLYKIDCKEGDKECIWREHIKTAIVRTIIEVSFPYVLKEVETVELKNKTVLVVCPPEEYHEIGAKMAHDYFLMNGYESIFIGANTPLEVILDAMKYTKPNYVAISVTNYYNIIKAKQITTTIKENYPDTIILAGGQAFNQPDALKTVQADKHITDFESIKNL